MGNSSRRKEREQRTLEVMVGLYCSDLHGHKAEVCEECRHLLEFALERIEDCPWGDDKPTCAKCAIHCYRAEEREQILQRMRHSGPRMISRHPVLAILHLLDKRRASDLESLRGRRKRQSMQSSAS